MEKTKSTFHLLFQDSKVLSEATLNPRVKLVEYAVRGPIVARALAIEKELKQVRARVTSIDLLRPEYCSHPPMHLHCRLKRHLSKWFAMTFT